MADVFVVMGTTGEHSDRTEWPVGAFKSEDAANRFVETLQDRYRQVSQGKQAYHRSFQERCQLDEFMADLDPEFSEDYTGTSWYPMRVPVKD